MAAPEASSLRLRRPPQIGLSLQGAEILRKSGPDHVSTNRSAVPSSRLGQYHPMMSSRGRGQMGQDRPSVVKTPDLAIPRWPTPRMLRSGPQGVTKQLLERPPRPFTHASRNIAEQHYRLAMELIEKPKMLAAEKELVKALEANPNHGKALCELAKIKKAIRCDYRTARQLFERVLVLRPSDAQALGGLAELEEFAMGDTQRAGQLYEAALEEGGCSTSTLAHFSLYLQAQELDPPRSRQLMQQCLAREPTRPWLQNNAHKF